MKANTFLLSLVTAASIFSDTTSAVVNSKPTCGSRLDATSIATTGSQPSGAAEDSMSRATLPDCGSGERGLCSLTGKQMSAMKALSRECGEKGGVPGGDSIWPKRDGVFVVKDCANPLTGEGTSEIKKVV